MGPQGSQASRLAVTDKWVHKHEGSEAGGLTNKRTWRQAISQVGRLAGLAHKQAYKQAGLQS